MKLKKYDERTLMYLIILNQNKEEGLKKTTGMFDSYMFASETHTKSKQIVEELKDFGIEARYDLQPRENFYLGVDAVTFYLTWEN